MSALGGPWELYNLETDRTELKNLAQAEPARVAALTAAWTAINGAPETGMKKRRANSEPRE